MRRLLERVLERYRRYEGEKLKSPWEIPYGEKADELAIYHCFTLLLGRSPHKEEWAGHSARAGDSLKDVVQTYLNSGEFKARNLLASAMPGNIIQKHNGRFEVFADPDDSIIGKPVLNGEYEPQVTGVIEQLLAPGDTFLDVGANLGYFSLLAAQRVGPQGHVYAIEPNDLNVKLLESSIKANGFTNVAVMQVGASETISTLMLHSHIGNGTTSAFDGRDLFSSRTVAGLPIDTLLACRTRPVNVIKIDVEGFEYRALRGAERLLENDRPNVVFEFAARGIDGIGGAEFLRWIQSKGYTLVNIERSSDVSRDHSVDDIMAAFDRSMADHIDVLAKPDVRISRPT